jgi:hypothetical protein
VTRFEIWAWLWLCLCCLAHAAVFAFVRPDESDFVNGFMSGLNLMAVGAGVVILLALRLGGREAAR